MSQARLYQSTFAARQGKTLKCEKCGEPIVKGERYIWFKVGFRSPFKHVRHMRHQPLDSERESSLLSGVMSAREDAESNIAGLMWNGDAESLISDIRSELESAADGWRDVAGQYADAAESMGEGAGANMQETADSIESAADELTSWDPDEDEPDLEHESHGTEDEPAPDPDTCEDCQSIRDQWASDVQDSAVNHLTEAEGQIEVQF